MLVSAGCELALRDGDTKTDVHLHGAIQRYYLVIFAVGGPSGDGWRLMCGPLGKPDPADPRCACRSQHTDTDGAAHSARRRDSPPSSRVNA